MIGFRPKTNALFLERPRLLRMLPEEPGYVVWLEAPYGYGKSVLTSQWAAKLEGAGWRVVWLAMATGDLHHSLTQVLHMPDSTPWPILLSELGRELTVLILEDLEDMETSSKLSPLLKHHPGLLLLASRQQLFDPEIPRLQSEGRLVHLGAEQLAFTQEEAGDLFADSKQAKSAWERTRGWSLPLHLTALTGEVPEGRALIEGVRESLSEAEWREALFLASLPYLPKEKARSETTRLAEAGFVQSLEGGYRLHPLVADSLFELYAQEVRKVLQDEAYHLEPLMQGEALEKAGLRAKLADLLEAHPELSLQNPQAVLRWDGLAGGERGQGRMAVVGDALCSLGRLSDGIPMLLAAARRPQSSPEEALAAYRDAVWWLAENDVGQAKVVTQEAEPLLDKVSPISAARFLNNVSHIYFQTQEYPLAEALLRRALALLPPQHPRRFGILLNLGILRWNHAGDLETRLQTGEEALRYGRDFIAQRVAIAHVDLGRYQWLLGRPEAALAHWREAELSALPQPWDGLEAQALKAIYSHRFEDLPTLLQQIKTWERPFTYHRVMAFWALAYANQGKAQEALEILPNLESPLILSQAVRALALAQLGNPRALEVLGTEPSERDREQALYWHAIRYRITRLEAHLETLLRLTLVGEKVLVGLIPLAELPPGRPELARVYPLNEVLKSGWKAAIALRIAEIPPLEVWVLGQWEIHLLGKPISLAHRPSDLMILLLLGYKREAITEALWPEVEPQRGRNNFYVNLNQLRKALEPWGIPTYLLEDSLVHTRCDLWELQNALAQGRAEDVLRLYHDTLAPNLDLPLLNETREQLHQQVLEVLLQGATLASPEQAEAYLERLLELEPLHEEALYRLLCLWISLGRRSTARQRYEAFSLRLAAELGLEPPPEIRQLFSR